MGKLKGYVGICYHYIRQPLLLEFPGILGTSVADFYEHTEMLSNNYQVISPKEALQFSYGEFSLDDTGVLITFDDGLSDHYLAASILAERNIKALFFIPTCILVDDMPANSTILHYCLQKYRIAGFLEACKWALIDLVVGNNLRYQTFNVIYKKGTTDPWEIIAEIKEAFKYKLNYRESRDILLWIYKNWFLKDYPEALSMMHLTKEQISSMLEMGHSIGTHTHTHISMAATHLDSLDFRKELIAPKDYLERTFDTSVKAFSYPFGQNQDCFRSEELLNKTNKYELAFTVERILNKRTTCPLELGRHTVTGGDTAVDLNRQIKCI